MAEAEQNPAPETEQPKFDDEKAAHEGIGALGQNARAIWFTLLGYLAFVSLTLMGVPDVDFYSAASETTLPIVNISIPTYTFFGVAPALGAVLHVYFHLYLLKLWDALTSAPPMIDGIRLGDRIFPWLVNDWALSRRPDRNLATTKRPLDRLRGLVMIILVWFGAPFVIGWFWWRSMVAHDPWLTVPIGIALVASLYATFQSWRRARARHR